MQIKFISYGHKFYEAEGKEPPKHDNLFNVRDLDNPHWEPELEPHNGLDKCIIDFFKGKEEVQGILQDICKLVVKLINKFIQNESRKESDSLTFAFRCTGGKHRSVYFAQSVYDYVTREYADIIKEGKLSHKLEFSVDHLELHRYKSATELATNSRNG